MFLVRPSLHVVFPVRLEGLRAVSLFSVENSTKVLSYVRPNHPHPGTGQVEEVVVPLALPVDSLAGTGASGQHIFAQSGALAGH